ncbi:hypothetical protein NE237_010242 [Protea cynaroides]|uniref:NAB domain-containing protein n=1 Tax=Protea cynaroides TaxID=273540 RepID=A0A9Q0KYX9_9MAGN|nr:hypothetical protein NE237_010242 [Protea cynaroides]
MKFELQSCYRCTGTRSEHLFLDDDFEAKMSKNLKKMESTKSHSWWWDSHICPKSSKLMADGLEEMDRSVLRMLKLIEGDGDSFAKKADMYYQKRPELISHVEDFYRMYRSLAERYNHLTGELRKNIPSELQSQSSGLSDAGSEQSSPDRKFIRRKHSHRAAGFDFFLGSTGGGNNDPTQNVEDSSSACSDSELDSDDDSSSVNNYSVPTVNGDGEGLLRRIIELEIELRDSKEKLRVAEEGYKDACNAKITDTNKNNEIVAGYEEQLRITNGKLKIAEGEIVRLKRELGNYESMKLARNSQAQLELAQKDIPMVETENQSGQGWSDDLNEQIAGLEVSVSALDRGSLLDKLKITSSRLRDKEDEIARLKLELDNTRSSVDGLEDAAREKHEVLSEKSQEPELLERITGLEANLLSRSHDIEELEQKLKMTEESLQGSEKEIARLVRESHEATSNMQVELQAAHKDIAVQEVALGSERRQVSELQEQIKKYKLDISNLKEELFHTALNFSAEKEQLQAEISKLTEERAMLEVKLKEWETRKLSLQEEIEQLKGTIAQRDDAVEALDKDLDALKLQYDMMVEERDDQKTKMVMLMAEVSCKDNRIQKMDEHLNRLQKEQLELITGAEKGMKLVKKLEEEVERQRVAISTGAEEKREAIRQLCFSLDHYRNRNQQLRQAFMGNHKRHHIVLAS